MSRSMRRRAGVEDGGEAREYAGRAAGRVGRHGQAIGVGAVGSVAEVGLRGRFFAAGVVILGLACCIAADRTAAISGDCRRVAEGDAPPQAFVGRGIEGKKRWRGEGVDARARQGDALILNGPFASEDARAIERLAPISTAVEVEPEIDESLTGRAARRHGDLEGDLGGCAVRKRRLGVHAVIAAVLVGLIGDGKDVVDAIDIPTDVRFFFGSNRCAQMVTQNSGCGATAQTAANRLCRRWGSGRRRQADLLPGRRPWVGLACCCCRARRPNRKPRAPRTQ